MKNYKKTLIASCLGIALVLFAWVPRADACYMFPTLSAAENSFSSFVSDFNRWDASLNYDPLLALASTPASDQVDMVLVLWWLWMNGYGRSSQVGGPGVVSLSSFSPSHTPAEQPAADTTSGGFSFVVPPLGYNPPTPPIGIILDEPPSTPPGGVKGPQGGNPQPNISAMPEPSTLTLLGLGIVSAAGYGWRRWNAQA